MVEREGVRPKPANVERSGEKTATPLNPLLALQRSAGNAATTTFLASMASPRPADPVVQRRFERGSGTGWGWPTWVDGGKALWDSLETGFNVELLDLLEQMRALKDKPGISSQLAKTEAFVKTWDGRPAIYHDSNPPGQDLDAGQLATQVRTHVANARSAIERAKQPTVPLTPLSPTSKADGRGGAKSSPPSKKGPSNGAATKTAEPKKVEPRAVEPKKVEPKVEATAEATETPSQPVPSKPAAKTPKKNNAQAAKEAKKAQAELELAKRQKANQDKRDAQQARLTIVESFGALIKTETKNLIRDEKIIGWSNVFNELDESLAKAKSQVMSSSDTSRALKGAYDTWTATLAERRQASHDDKQGTILQWRTWLGLTTYTIIDSADLTNSSYTSLRPEAGTEGPSGESYDIHVTLDPSQVRAPTSALNNQTVDELLSDLLSVSNVGLRIHATLELDYEPRPHVYWFDNDLAQGSRYPRGAAEWAAPGGPREKVAAVLHDYVTKSIRPAVVREHARLTYKPYAWPAFDTLSGPLLGGKGD